MSTGPVIVFDKSFLQGLSVDEACWLDNFYLCNITPLFFAETLADLKKQMVKGRTPEQVVGNLAAKTPCFGAVNCHHSTLCLADLLGYPVSMSQRPILPRGTVKSTGDRTGVMFENAPEKEAFERWQAGSFLEVEQQFARVWREMLSRSDLVELSESLRGSAGRKVPIHTLEEAMEYADRSIEGRRNRFAILKQALGLLTIPLEYHDAIISRWKASGGLPLSEFAPYASHVLRVDLFFYYALAARLISPNRPSNRIDMAYLYYLPFCMAFVSSDKLHARTVPMFLTSDQEFVDGVELKRDLGKIDTYYSSFPQSTREQGIMSFAQHPPLDAEFLTVRLWDRFLPPWRNIALNPLKTTKEEEHRIVEMLRQIDEAPPMDLSIGADEGDFMMISHRIPPIRGKWRIVSREIEAAESR